MSVEVKLGNREIPSYPLGEPERNPVFFEKRVYQGSRGSVYPVPFIDKVFDDPVACSYQVATLENEYVYLEMLPEIGGRVFKGQDKTNDNYDFIYRQDVIKPALVGLAGPWLSGGIEFNWPQHHRPGTYLPSDVFIEEEADGARTVWMSELDSITRMKGMHGVRLRPGSSLVELRVRLFNRTPLTQTFLWWANLAARVHEQFQSFFPPDVTYVADHAVRATSSFPNADSDYYGVPYGERAGANDLRWYKNIPVPTSYMVCETQGSFFGGYDFEKQGGFLHVANRHISPGKKQWTWGNHEFGWAWDRELTDEGGPYVELMAGVYTDNQPDFSYLLPYETKTFSQFWWPIQKTGPVHEANEEVALRLDVDAEGRVDAAVLVSRKRNGLLVLLREGDRKRYERRCDIEPGQPLLIESFQFEGEDACTLCLEVWDDEGALLASYRPAKANCVGVQREPATEPPMPEKIDSVEELFLVGEHLELYRHPTRSAEIYWEEGVKRNPGDIRCNVSLGKEALKRGEFEKAELCFQKAIESQTRFHPNPSSGEASYYLGLCHRYLGANEAAYSSLYKATWNFEWRASAYYELACIDLLEGRASECVTHARRSLETNSDNSKAIVALSLGLDRIGHKAESKTILEEALERDPLDPWLCCQLDFLEEEAGALLKARFRNDAQTVLDVAFDYAKCGAYSHCRELLTIHLDTDVSEVATPNPLERSQSILFLQAWCEEQLGDLAASERSLQKAEQQSGDYFFPSRLDEQVLLEWACSKTSHWLPRYGLGNYFYDKRRHDAAIAVWESAVQSGTQYGTVYRNLGIAYWNTARDGDAAERVYLKAIELNSSDARLVFEYDQLRKKIGVLAIERIAFFEKRRELVLSRDDSSVEYAALLNEVGRFEESLALLEGRRFHPWEGGEGKVLRQYTLARIGLGEAALADEKPSVAYEHFSKAMDTPQSLGEAYHMLQAKADVNYWLGKALLALGREKDARERFEASASEAGDFQNMALVEYSENSYYQGLALGELGRREDAVTLFRDMLSYVEQEREVPAKIDYFATSLPNLLVFEDDIGKSKTDNLDRLFVLANKGLEVLANDGATVS